VCMEQTTSPSVGMLAESRFVRAKRLGYDLSQKDDSVTSCSKRLTGLTAFFLLATVLTGVTGFMFPATAQFTPAELFGVVSLIVRPVAICALCRPSERRLALDLRGRGAVRAVSQYRKVFVLDVQSCALRSTQSAAVAAREARRRRRRASRCRNTSR
jgi:hypothetical protein